MVDSESIRGRVREVRRESDLSQSSFAQKLGVPFRSYQAIEGGERGPSLECVDALFEQFGVNPLWLLRGIGPKRGDANSISVAVFRGLVNRWQRYPAALTIDEQVEDFARVLEHATKIGLSEELMDIAVRRVG